MKTKILLAAAAVVLACGNLDAQRKLWGGLDKPQPAEELPVGKASPTQPQRVDRQPVRNSNLVPAAEQGDGFTIEGGWRLFSGKNVAEAVPAGAAGFIHEVEPGWFDAVVPGTVLTTLVANGVYPDPYYGLDNLGIPDSLARTDWWYETEFDATPAPKRSGERTWLIFDGINYRAEIFLNGQRIGDIAGAFMRGRFDVTEILRRGGGNNLAVHIFPPDHPGIPHEQTMKGGQGLNGGALSLDGPTFISSVGWDWIPGIRDRNVGIWQPVRLVTTRDVVMGDPCVVADLPLPDTTSVKLSVAVPLKNNSGRPVEGEIEVEIAGGVDLVIPYRLAAGEEKEYGACAQIENPRLWWPNGYGAPELYTANLTVRQGGNRREVSDRRTVRFGIRELAYELMVQLPDGSQKRVLHTPTDSKENTPAFDYVTRGRYNKDIQLPALAGVTDMAQVADHMARHGLTELSADDPVGPYFAVRVNGRRVFCRGGNWGMDDGMKRVSRERLEPYFRLHRDAGFNMIRNWTGESTEEVFYALCDEYGIMVWNDFWITTDDTVEPLDADLFMANARDAVLRFRNHPSITVWCPRNEGFAPANLERRLPDMMAATDPTRHYHGQSRYLNMDSSGPWSYFEDPALYYSKNAKGFITEIGTFAIPTASSIRKFIAPDDLWPINDVWAYHDMHHTSQNFAGFMRAIDRYGAPTSMEDFERKAQLVCYDAWRAIMESWNSRMWNTATGQLVWMSHPAWPSFIWQTYTWDYQTPGSYFGAKKASEPLHVQLNLDDSTVMVVNNTRRDETGLTVRVSYIDPIGGAVTGVSTHRADAPAAQATKVAVAAGGAGLPALYILRAELLDGNKVLSVNDYWRAETPEAYAAINEIPKAELHITHRDGAVTVKNISAAMALNVKLDAADPASGEIMLPAYFSDGYFNLTPGEERTIGLSLPQGNVECRIVATGYNIQ
jgi:hypothetical protein